MKTSKFDISSAGLHILAMALMFCDHLWATIVPGNNWLTCIGRLAFPIFAFLLVEGYVHTGSIKKYTLRLLLFALLSEIPFNLMYISGPIYPFHQNVIWTLLIGLGMIHLNEKVRCKGKILLTLLTAVGTILLGAGLGLLSFADYGSAGVLTILLFYFFRGRAWWCFAGQLAGMYWLNFEVMKGLSYDFLLFGHRIFFPQQGFALLALIPLWLYRGRKGFSARWFQYLCYSFYPVHMLLLWLIRYLA